MGLGKGQCHIQAGAKGPCLGPGPHHSPIWSLFLLKALPT